MATVTVEGGTIRIRLQGWAKLWALKGALDIPVSCVRSVVVAPSKLRPRGLRAPGTALPGVIYAGTYRWRGIKEFWSVRHAEKALVLDLEGHTYTRVVVEVSDPAAVVTAIEQAGSRVSAR
jgi:hypothetical protein